MRSPDFRTFMLRLSCVHVQTFVRSTDFRAFPRFICVHHVFVRSWSDFRAFNRFPCVHAQTFVRSCPDVRAFTGLSCVHVQIFVFFNVSRLCNFERTMPLSSVWTYLFPSGTSTWGCIKMWTIMASLMSHNRVRPPAWGADPNCFMIRTNRAHTRVFLDRNYRVLTEVWAHFSLDHGLELVWSEVNLVWKIWS